MPVPGTNAWAGPSAASFYGKVPNPSLIPHAATMNLTDMGLGARLAIHYKDRIAFCTSAKGGFWVIWTGTHWTQDVDGVAVESFARTVIASVSTDEAEHAKNTDPDVLAAQSAQDTAKALGQGPKVLLGLQAALESAEQRAIYNRKQFGERCENGVIHLTAAIKAAQAHLSVPADKFDTNPYLMNFKNGTLDLRTKTLTPHDPKQYITKVCAVDYVPEAWNADLNQILTTLAKSDAGLPLFLQRYLGSATTGLCTSKAFLYVKGAADAGKTTLFQAFAHALGDVNGDGYGRVVSPSLFALSSDSGESAQPKLHDLMGVLFILADEAERGFMDRETVNKMSAGGQMQTRQLHGKPVSWRSRAKIVFAGNDWMGIPDNDPGIARRLIACELTHKLTPEELDVNLQDRIVTSEALQAIMAWAIDGAHDWILGGADRAALHPTPVMEAASARYLTTADPLEAWWDAYIVQVEEGSDEATQYVPLTTAQFHARYAKYCRDHGTKVKVDERHFAARLTTRGFPARPTAGKFRLGGAILNTGKFRQGIRHIGATTAIGIDLTNF